MSDDAAAVHDAAAIHNAASSGSLMLDDLSCSEATQLLQQPMDSTRAWTGYLVRSRDAAGQSTPFCSNSSLLFALPPHSRKGKATMSVSLQMVSEFFRGETSIKACNLHFTMLQNIIGMWLFAHTAHHGIYVV